MSNITIKRSETTVTWDIYDSKRCVQTQASFRPFQIEGLSHRSFHVSFNGEFAGMDHCWTHPGDDIVAFLERLEFSYTMNKLLGARHEDVFDTDTMNEEFFDWMREAFKDEDDVDDFVEAAEGVVSIYGDQGKSAYETINGYMEYMASPSENELLWQMKELYEERLDSFENNIHYKWIYTYFWESIWPVFVSAVEEYMKERVQ